MYCFRELTPPPWTIRIGFWLALGVYLVAFVLPCQIGVSPQNGMQVFLLGIWGLILAFAGCLQAIGPGAPGEWPQVLAMVVAVLPWLANPVFWFALAHFGQGSGRAAFGTSLAATLIAGSYLILGGLWGASPVVAASPAYCAWLASMVLLTGFSWGLARHNERTMTRDAAAWDVQDLSEDVPFAQRFSERPREGAALSSPSFFLRATGKIR